MSRNRPTARCGQLGCGRAIGHTGACALPRIDALIRDAAHEVVAAYDIAGDLPGAIEKLRKLLRRVPWTRDGKPIHVEAK